MERIKREDLLRARHLGRESVKKETSSGNEEKTSYCSRYNTGTLGELGSQMYLPPFSGSGKDRLTEQYACSTGTV